MTNDEIISTEKAVLGAMLGDNSCVPEVVAVLKPECFYDGNNRNVMRAIVDLYAAGKPIDNITVKERLRANHQLPPGGGSSYLNELMNSVATSVHAQTHAEIVHDHYMRREILRVLASGKQLAAKHTTPFELMDTVLGELAAIDDPRNTSRVKAVAEVRDEVMRDVIDIVEHGKPIGIQTGFTDLDRILGGLQKTDLIILGARPSVGKTALALAVGAKVAVRGTPVLLVSLEMGRRKLVHRIASMSGAVVPTQINLGQVSPEELRRIFEAQDDLYSAPLFIDDSPGLTLLEIKSRARKLFSGHDNGLLIIDYLQLMRSSGYTQNREREIAQFSSGLKAIAKELNVPVVALSQLRRTPDNEQKKPTLTDLRESGAIEQDADVVMFLYRLDQFDKTEFADGTPTKVQREGANEPDSVINAIVAKHRNGPTGSLYMLYDKAHNSFYNYNHNPGDAPPSRRLSDEFTNAQVVDDLEDLPF